MLFLFLFGTLVNSWGQLPLQYGDAIVTHSPNSQGAPGAVVRTIKTNNTLGAPLGANWNTATMIPSGNKPANWNASNWVNGTLGAVFGITLNDKNLAPDIFVSSTQIYSPGTSQSRKVWKLDGTSGMNYMVYDFNNPSGSGSVTSSRSLGNLKFSRFLNNEYIYVSDFESGKVFRLTGNSSANSLWTIASSFQPKFGGTSVNAKWLPYGIAIRKSGANAKLYYSKLDNTSTATMKNTFEIWTVDLDVAGDFVAGTETQLALPVFLGTDKKTPISDIAFTKDGNKMLIGQQTWEYFSSSLGAHNSGVYEFTNFPVGSNTWVSSGNNFPAGTYNQQRNCAGGVSYSDNILLTNNEYACDTSVYLTSDAILLQSIAKVYGIEGYSSSGGTNFNAIWIDQDDNITTFDKTFLGDIEIYKNPNVCVSCNCGDWISIGYNGNDNWWVNSSDGGTPVPTLSFDLGNTAGVLFPNYECEGDCEPTYTFTISNGKVIYSIDESSFDLGNKRIRSLPCGNYTIEIIPHCGNSECSPVLIPLVIICPPPCPDCGGNARVLIKDDPIYNSTNGTVAVGFTISNDIPVTEIRALIEEFRITSLNDNENCILCKNTPKSWGSILNASFASISPAFSNAATIDNREVIFNNGGVFTLPDYISMQLSLPATTGLDCCKLNAEICIKFIIRDVNCCEKEILKCFSVKYK